MSDTADKTSIISTETFKGKLKAADDAPPAVVVLVGPQGYVGKQWLITKSDMIIGRSVEAELYVSDASLSRSHARFEVVGNDIFILDMGSTNKTIVNGMPLAPMTKRKLVNNDQIKTGNVIFKFLEKGNLESITNQQVFEKAQKDALTGAFSKGALLEKGPEAVKRAEVLSEPLSVITFDIDHFKKINDTYGHPGGDYVLKELGSLMQSKLVRSNDYFARYGGEEFVVILQATPLKTAQEVAERIRHTVEAHPFLFNGQQIKVTISIGVSTGVAADSWDKIYNRADQALYQSKQNGRNRVTVSA
ncbi:diguanylate cyclase [Pseudobdellovibrio exovorus]|uniref:diguanylate cyclase n=1 Tax=Pseudobdellovibrio exovorus JSS TaxID=1184267 RepID=M4VP46_9BACT|nr:diguanylate cyclase [Pseudobdellovibrio exovorus]AGH94904.1 GGDEF domain-containing protein [Pseudobdellovibrio exovorus JSS]